MGFFKLSICPNLIKDCGSRISYSDWLIDHETKNIFVHTLYKPIHQLIFMIKQIIVKITSSHIVATGRNFRQTIIEVQKKKNIISICVWIWGSVNCSTDNWFSTTLTENIDFYKLAFINIDWKNFSSIIVISSPTKMIYYLSLCIPTPPPLCIILL